jgi:truncated hemoglobin YjbI
MWEALKEGDGLNEILDNFYTKVYLDERLSPFFIDVTKKRAIEKQHSFLRSIFTGEKCYFGEHPKKAHNWMVISDELFDYREKIMESCLIEYGLDEELIRRWRELEEIFRKVIVKQKPLDVSIGNIKRPTEGYVAEVIEVDSLCDMCQSEVKADSKVTMHIRTGKIYCDKCEKELDKTIYVRKNNREYELVK